MIGKQVDKYSRRKISYVAYRYVSRQVLNLLTSLYAAFIFEVYVYAYTPTPAFVCAYIYIYVKPLPPNTKHPQAPKNKYSPNI